MERPARKRLLQDVDAGKVNVIVVYKVDRLTRSLADFAKIAEAFDAKAVSFVSVTQQFNTTTSMGRLTLNVLLSFAQFEREVTGERIRDEIAASKKKGIWMGGFVPLGYDLERRKLVPNPREACLVSKIFSYIYGLVAFADWHSSWIARKSEARCGLHELGFDWVERLSPEERCLAFGPTSTDCRCRPRRCGYLSLHLARCSSLELKISIEMYLTGSRRGNNFARKQSPSFIFYATMSQQDRSCKNSADSASVLRRGLVVIVDCGWSEAY
jgi:hypothetical protein